MKKILLTACLSIAMFGATNELLNPNNNKVITDIGFLNPQSNYNPNVGKEWVESNASLRTVQKAYISKERILSNNEDCEIDYLGREGCPIQEQDCTAKVQTDPGVATKIPKILYKLKEKTSVPRDQSLYPNEIKGAIKLNPTAGAVNGSIFNIVSDGVSGGGAVGNGTVMMNQGYSLNGKFAMKLFNFGSGYGGFTVNPKPSTVTTLINGGSSVGLNQGYTISSPDGRYAVILAVWDSVPGNLTYQCDDFCLIGKPDDIGFGFWNYKCDEPFIAADTLTDGTGKCKKDYSYYNYTCKTTTNEYDKPWLGPVISTGEDCNGQCGPNGCECNSSIPPVNNCVRDTYTCPTNASQLCVITTDNKNNNINNILDGWIYDKGIATKQENSILIDKTCPNLNNDSIENNIWNKQKDICESNLLYSCLDNTFTYDKDLKECQKSLSCEGVLNGSTCKSEAIHTCPTGYIYDQTDIRCERFPICDRGEYNLISDTCQQKGNGEMCPTGYTWESSRNRCEKPLLITNPECPGEGLVFNTTTKVCEGFADLYNWEKKGPPSAGNWTYNNTTKELFQSINGQPTFFVSKANYPASTLEGKFKVSDTGDDDWAGIVFGWTSDVSFYAFDWKKGDQGAAREGVRLMKVNTMSGDAFASWGDPNTNASKLILDSDYSYSGWSRNTWYTLKLQFSEGKIEAFINNVSVLSYENASLDLPISKIGFLNVSQKDVHYKDFKISTLPICSAGYVYDVITNKCYENVLNADNNLKVKYTTPSCPNGSWNSVLNMCNFVAKCTYGGLIDNNDDRCVTTESPSCPTDKNYVCPAGYFYETLSNKCEKVPECNNGSNYNYLTNKCEAIPTCPTEYVYNLTSKKCEKALDFIPLKCNNDEIFINGDTIDKCKLGKTISYIEPVSNQCQSGYIKVESEGMITCYKLNNCPAGYVTGANINYCERTLTCPTGYNISNENNLCYK